MLCRGRLPHGCSMTPGDERPTEAAGDHLRPVGGGVPSSWFPVLTSGDQERPQQESNLRTRLRRLSSPPRVGRGRSVVKLPSCSGSPRRPHRRVGCSLRDAA